MKLWSSSKTGSNFLLWSGSYLDCGVRPGLCSHIGRPQVAQGWREHASLWLRLITPRPSAPRELTRTTVSPSSTHASTETRQRVHWGHWGHARECFCVSGNIERYAWLHCFELGWQTKPHICLQTLKCLYGFWGFTSFLSSRDWHFGHSSLQNSSSLIRLDREHLGTLIFWFCQKCFVRLGPLF